MFVLSSFSNSLEFSLVNCTSIHKSPESNAFKKK